MSLNARNSSHQGEKRRLGPPFALLATSSLWMVGPLRIPGPGNSTGFLAVGAGQTRRDREYSNRHSIKPMHFIAIVYVG